MASERIFLDTDSILDLILDREPYSGFSEKIFALPAKYPHKIFTSSLVIANTYYFAAKHRGRKIANEIIYELQNALTILSFGSDAINFALTGIFNDFEDAIQYFTAKHHHCTVILTRNLSDYKSASIPVMTAQQYLSMT